MVPHLRVRQRTFVWLPKKLDPASVEITAGGDRRPVIADDFLMVPLPPADSEEAIEISFRARWR